MMNLNAKRVGMKFLQVQSAMSWCRLQFIHKQLSITMSRQPAGIGKSTCISALIKGRLLQNLPLLQICRTIFSKTGIWNKDLNKDVQDAIEQHWQPIIRKEDEERSLKFNGEKDKYYVLSMFPYPSGKLHMGHVRVYTLSDTMARFHRLAGRNVIHPMGWDAFGLPAENAAIERGERPEDWTYRNIANMKQQLKRLGCSFDWHRELATCDPDYYKWTQYFFLKMLEAGLVYQKEGEVNWDPVDMTVLADEQIDEAGNSWRSGAKAEKKYLKHWCIRTTAKASSLYEGLSDVDPSLWNDIILLQKHWIGECDGTRLLFALRGKEGEHYEPLDIYTSAPEAVYGVAYVALSPQHYLSQQYLCQKNSCLSDKDIILPLQGVHPFTGKTIPVIVSSSTQFDYFNDMQLGIPSVDSKAKEVAEALSIDYSSVLENIDGEERLINSGAWNGLGRQQGFQAALKSAMKLGVGGHFLSRCTRDWLISRQRYWGTPIPIIHCDSCRAVPVPYKDLPVKLPAIDTFTGRGPSPLTQQHDWINTTCPKCGGPAKRETDTMDTFVDSSWYFLRYLDPHNQQEPFSKEVAQRMMPVDLYIGGKEHARMHLYYARFFSHFLHDAGLLKTREPFVSLLTQGMVMGQSYREKDTGRYLRADQVNVDGSKVTEKATGQPVVVQWEKMSKSKHNGVDPQDVMAEYGVDATRLCILSSVSPQSNRNWSNDAFKGILRWQGRIWRLIGGLIDECASSKKDKCDATVLAEWGEKLFDARNFAVKKMTFHCSTTFLLNTAVSHLQAYTTTLGKVPPPVVRESKEYRQCLADLCIMLAPMTPCFASELWQGLTSVCKTDTRLGHCFDKGVLDQPWPVVDAAYKLPLMLKINNKESSSILLSRDVLNSLTIDQAHELVRADPKYQQCCAGRNFQSIDFTLHPGYQADINIVIDKERQHAVV